MGILKVAGGMSAALAVLAMAVPAQAQDRRGGGRDHGGRDHGRGHHRGGDKIDAGDVLIGAAILGIFALATSGKNKDRGESGEYDGSEASQYDGVYDSESAAGRCAQAAEDEGHNYADRAFFKSISSTTWNGRSWVVKGRVNLT
ncbi:MAG: hypothetical protein EOP61_21765, partial [Sphingomonadales bacterium]